MNKKPQVQSLMAVKSVEIFWWEKKDEKEINWTVWWKLKNLS